MHSNFIKVFWGVVLAVDILAVLTLKDYASFLLGIITALVISVVIVLIRHDK